MSPFNPERRSTVEISVSSSSAAVRVRGDDESGAYQCLVSNYGTAPAWIEWGNGSVTAVEPNGATAGSMGVPAGSVQVFTLTGTHVAAVAAGATGVIEFTPGAGL